MSLDFATKALGLEPIHVATVTRNAKEVARILRKDPDKVNARNREGATALHLAVIFGCFPIVRLLLMKKASISVTDHEGCTPRTYARSGERRRHKIEQFQALGIESKKKRRGRDISIIFREPEALRAMLAKNNHPLSKTVLLRDGSKLSILKKIGEVDIGSPINVSTCGYMSSHGDMTPMPQMAAISGWKNTSIRPGVLPNNVFTGFVREAAKLLKFNLPKQPWDSPGQKEVPERFVGRWFASHIEKQLSTFWVIRLLREYLNTVDLSRMRELMDIEMPPNHKNVKIFLDHNPCGNCLTYLAVLRRATGITFSAEVIPFVLMGSRAKKAGACKNCTCESCSSGRKIPPLSRAGPSMVSDEAFEEMERNRQEDFTELDQNRPDTAEAANVPGFEIEEGPEVEKEVVDKQDIPIHDQDNSIAVEAANEVDTVNPFRDRRRTLLPKGQIIRRFRHGVYKTSPPKRWVRFPDGTSKPIYKKRRLRAVDKDDSEDGHDDPQESVVRPKPRQPVTSFNLSQSSCDSVPPREVVSMMNGVSAFFGDGSPSQRQEEPGQRSSSVQHLNLSVDRRRRGAQQHTKTESRFQIPHQTPILRMQNRPLPERSKPASPLAGQRVSNKPQQKARFLLGLKKFAYTGPSTSRQATQACSRSGSIPRRLQTHRLSTQTGISGGVQKKQAGRKPRAATKEAKIRNQSVFARAFQRHHQQQQGSQDQGRQQQQQQRVC
ncbi:hypothetical protein B0H63DRAFT_562869 [Podospora didyma]|uniref:Single-strand DNA deaminase toxin A-like C-terminal domain-containing protein n=1 Tax=Podospora didyma TaxID=330526 RepID=A0AAE0N8L9_9PEZI|nr:hypothetical protein B0H63DRAFT_562869 [Podospora didyma]